MSDQERSIMIDRTRSPLSFKLRAGKEELQVLCSDPLASIGSVLDIINIDAHRMTLIHRGKTIDPSLRVGGILQSGQNTVVLGIPKKGYSLPARSTPMEEIQSASIHIEDAQANSAIDMHLGDIDSQTDSFTIVLREGASRYRVHVHGIDFTASDLLALIRSQVRSAAVELIGQGRIIRMGDRSAISDFKSKELMVRRTAEFWETDAMMKVIESDRNVVSSLANSLNNTVKSYSVNSELNKLKLTKIRSELQQVLRNIELYRERVDSATRGILNETEQEIRNLLDQASAFL